MSKDDRKEDASKDGQEEKWQDWLSKAYKTDEKSSLEEGWKDNPSLLSLLFY